MDAVFTNTLHDEIRTRGAMETMAISECTRKRGAMETAISERE